MTTTPRKVLKQEESRAVFATYQRAHADALHDHDACANLERGGALTAISTAANAWLASLRNQQPLASQSTNKGMTAASPRIFCLPPEIVSMVLDYLNKRALTYELPLVCRSLRLMARQRRYWGAFVLRDLVLEDLPIVSRFVVLANTFRTQQEHREHFWLRHLAEGRWPSSPATIDLSTTTLVPRLLSRAIRACASTLRALHLGHCDATLTSDALDVVTTALNDANVSLAECDVSFCCRFTPHTLVSGPQGSGADAAVSGCLGLLASPSCRSLTSLDISSCEQLSDKDIATALYHVHAHIRRFACRNTALSCATFRDMATEALLQRATTTLQSLTHLNVAHCGAVDDACMALMVQWCPSLVELNVGGCGHITDVGLAALCNASSSGTTLRLTSLTIDDCHAITDVSVSLVLAACAASLRRLSLDRCTCRGTFFVVAVQQCTVLSVVSISGCLWIVREAARCVALRKGILSAMPRLNARSIAFLASHRMAAPVAGR